MRTINEIVDDLLARRDSNDLVVQRDGDSGDQAYRTAIASFLLTVLDHPKAKSYYKNMIGHLQVTPGVFRRSANSRHWAYNPNNLSRDQASALMLAAAAQGDHETANAFYTKAYDRKELLEIPKYGKFLRMINPVVGFHQNVHPGTQAPDSYRKVPDLIGIAEGRNEIRRKREWYKYPLLIAKDFGFLVDLKLRDKQVWDFDSLYAKDLIYANMVMPTPFSLLARLLYKKTNYINRIRFNYSDGNNGVDPLGELYELACRKFINNENS